MKTATVRDLRTRFPVVQSWLAEGEPVTITKSGKRIAMLTQAPPISNESLQTAFSKRFSKVLAHPKRVTNLTQLLVDDRGL
jgi:antitoxin (DNA-binding transcriptional repressor) of toxin-antitoxin stability system